MKRDFRMDIYRLRCDELSVAINPLDVKGMKPYASTFPSEVLTKILKENFSVDDQSLCDLGIQLAAQGRATITLHCTRNDLSAARFIPAG
jgi:hypothetical protein